jgi:hypothetical protein
MSKIIPNLVDKSLLDSILLKKPQSINIPQISIPNVNISNFNIKDILVKYWMFLIIILGIIGFFIYNYYNKKQKQKEEFSNNDKKTKKKQKKVRIEKYTDNITECANCKKSGASHCPACSQNDNFEGKMSEIDSGIRDLEMDESYENNTALSKPEYFQEPMTQESSYHNQFYGQSITDDAQGGFDTFYNSNNIESFNDSSMGNFVSF